MVYAFKNTDPGLVQCDFVDVLSDYCAFTDLFVADSSFFFASESEITDPTEWADNMTLGNIAPVYGIKSTEDNHDEPERERGIQDITIEKYKGKYHFIFYLNYDTALYNKIIKLDNRPVNVYLFDKNDNIYGKLDGTDIFGIRCELFSVQKLSFGSDNQPSGIKVGIIIDSDEATSIRMYKKDFDSLDFIYGGEEGGGQPPGAVTYSITSMTSSNPQAAQITVKDSDDNFTTGLLQAAFSISDNLNGTLTIDTFNEGSPGVYDFTFIEVITTGSAFATVPPLISHVYSLRNLSTVFLEAFDEDDPWGDISIQGTTQREYDNWDTTGVFVHDYEVSRADPLANPYDLELNVYTTGGAMVAGYWMRTAAKILELGKNYIVYIKFKSDYDTAGADDNLAVIYGQTSGEIGRISIEDTSSSYIYRTLQFTQTVEDWYFGIGVYEFPRQFFEIATQIQSIRIYEVL
ncbi:hypothetical protein KAR91_36860 [Candidatus Pacearchaeota archaeon]|nr:hypothetical protein [Candidatus Pacearchaeota archaeon]